MAYLQKLVWLSTMSLVSDTNTDLIYRGGIAESL